MLKKLAKYGNSTTLVIDKAILELLNMNESTIVKLKIDGPSLIVTPASAIAENEKVSYSRSEAFRIADQAIRNKVQKQVSEKLQAKRDKAFPEMQKEFQHLFKKHETVLARLHDDKSFQGQEYEEALKIITQKIDPSNDPEAFGAEVRKLNERLHHEFVDFNKDMEAIVKKYSHLK